MNEEITAQKSTELFPEEALKDLVEAGVFFGRRKSKANPKMKQYVLTNRGGIEIIDLHKTLEGMDAVLNFVSEKVKNGGLILFVATQPQAVQAITEISGTFNYPWVATRWLGGILTNFKIISRRIDQFKKLRSDLASGAFDRYTKKERVIIDSQIQKMDGLFGGLQTLNRLPDLLVVIDPNIHHTAIREAKRMNIPTVVFANVDSDPDMLDYFVAGNNKARKSINWFLGEIKKAIEKGKLAVPVAVSPKIEI